MKRTSAFSYVLAISMAVFYMAFAVFLVFSPIFEATFSLPVRIVVGIVFFLYALFRGYRIFKNKK